LNPADYDAWYATPRGRWIGEAEYRLAAQGLRARGGNTLLDVGCGTGWFSRRAAADGLRVTGLDPNAAWLDYARAHGGSALDWVAGDARSLPFPDASFDHVLSIAALCFIDDERAAVAECVRVAHKRVAIGWLNRASLLYRQKGQGGGAYRGARWHTARELRALVSGLPLRDLEIRSAVFLPSATPLAVALERGLPKALPWGSLLVLTGEKA
jgi:SAM-dependent methyltransferase